MHKLPLCWNWDLIKAFIASSHIIALRRIEVSSKVGTGLASKDQIPLHSSSRAKCWLATSKLMLIRLADSKVQKLNKTHYTLSCSFLFYQTEAWKVLNHLLRSQHLMAVGFIPKKVEVLNKWRSPSRLNQLGEKHLLYWSPDLLHELIVFYGSQFLILASRSSIRCPWCLSVSMNLFSKLFFRTLRLSDQFFYHALAVLLVWCCLPETFLAKHLIFWSLTDPIHRYLLLRDFSHPYLKMKQVLITFQFDQSFTIYFALVKV